MPGQRKSALRDMELRAVTSTDDSTWKGYGLLVITAEQDPNTETAMANSVASPPLNRKPNRHRLIPPLLPYASASAPHHPPHQVAFPLSPDHCLITLVQYNVVRALLLNLSILSTLDRLPLGCGHSLLIPRFGTVPPAMVPPDLRPSRLQRSTPHPFWIDAVPFPRVRDNLILMSGRYDSDDLFYDLGRGIYEGFDSVERRGYLVWGEPWCARGWEVSEGFLRKWGFLLAGCEEEVMGATNHWRSMRGEDGLVVEVMMQLMA